MGKGHSASAYTRRLRDGPFRVVRRVAHEGSSGEDVVVC
jgi:hypothetical protein